MMALSTEHANLVDAISHALAKSEQLSASNVAHQPHFEKKESNHNNSHKNGNGNGNQNKQSNTQNNNDKSSQKSGLFCKYCKRNNHTIENCRSLARKNGNSGNKPNAEKLENHPQSSSTAVAAKQTEQQQNNEQTASSVSHLDMQSLSIQPYHHLNC